MVFGGILYICFMKEKTASVRISESVLGKVKKHTKKTKQSIGGFLDLAAIEKIRADKLTQLILKTESN